MKPMTCAALLATALCGVGCSGTESELLDAINTDKVSSKLCVSPQTLGVDFFEANDGTRYFSKAGDFSFSGPSSSIDALPALRKRGYANEEADSLPAGFARYKDAYRATDKIVPYTGEFENLCIGTMKATEIIDYTEPGESGQQIVQARFKYKIDFNDLVDDLDIEDELMAGPIKQNWSGMGTSMYTKTNKGWRLEMATWVDR